MKKIELSRLNIGMVPAHTRGKKEFLGGKKRIAEAEMSSQAIEERGVRDTIGRRIRALRRGKGHSQENLAEQTSLSANYISRIESGERLPSIDVLCNIAEALGGIETYELLVKEETTRNFSYKKKQLIKILNESKPREISLYLEVITALHKNNHGEKVGVPIDTYVFSNGRFI